MDSIPVVLMAFKLLVLVTGMYFAIKWHYDQEKKEKRALLLRASGKAVAFFMLSLLGLGLLTFFLAKQLGLDLTMP